jgi:ectoine hydroxylase-related dioxygenase (phytanoyl-CoA dioxygenase family)
LIMFPAWLWHCVEENKSNDVRISVSFNFVQEGFQ